MKIEIVEVAIGIFTFCLAFAPGPIYRGRLGGLRHREGVERKPIENQRAARLTIFILGLAEIIDGAWRVFLT